MTRCRLSLLSVTLTVPPPTSVFTSQMKQSLEKLHRNIVVPEVQQDASADTLAESLTEA